MTNELPPLLCEQEPDILSPAYSIRRSAAKEEHRSLVQCLSEADLGLLEERWKPRDFRSGDLLGRLDEPSESCFFLHSGSVSILCQTSARRPVGVGSLGPGDLVGLPAALGVHTPEWTATAISPGMAFEITLSDLRTVTVQSRSLQETLMRYVAHRMLEMMRIAACNVRHEVGQRLATWILTIDDHLVGAPIVVTHDTVSTLLGVRRASITTALHILEGEGAIRSRRSKIILRDRNRLEQLCCGCYWAVEGGGDPPESPSFEKDGPRQAPHLAADSPLRQNAV